MGSHITDAPEGIGLNSSFGFTGFQEDKAERKNGKKTALENSIKKYDKDIDTLVTLITNNPLEALIERLNKLETERDELRGQLKSMSTYRGRKVSVAEVECAIFYARQMLKEKTLPNIKRIIDTFVESVVIYEDYIQINFTFSQGKLPVLPISQDEREELVKGKSRCVHVTHLRGGEGGI